MQLVLCKSMVTALLCSEPVGQTLVCVRFLHKPWVVRLLQDLWGEKVNPHLEYVYISEKTNTGPSRMKKVQSRWLVVSRQQKTKKGFPLLRSRGPGEDAESSSVWLKGRVHWLVVGGGYELWLNCSLKQLYIEWTVGSWKEQYTPKSRYWSLWLAGWIFKVSVISVNGSSLGQRIFFISATLFMCP